MCYLDLGYIQKGVGEQGNWVAGKCKVNCKEVERNKDCTRKNYKKFKKLKMGKLKSRTSHFQKSFLCKKIFASQKLKSYRPFVRNNRKGDGEEAL